MAMIDTITDEDIRRATERVPLAFTAPRPVRIRRAVLWAVFAALFCYCLWAFNFSPMRFVEGVERFGRVASFMFPPAFWTEWRLWEEVFVAIGETVAMAFLGTLFGAIIAFPLAFFGAKNINRWEWPRIFFRRGFDTVRAFEQLVLALIFIRAFGLGPLAGIMAIAVSEIGTLAKLFAEAIENTSEKPVDGVRASGGSSAQSVRYAILPQAAPVIISQILYNFESNTRSSTILGIVGAGGIGFMLFDRIGANRWDEVWTMIILIVITVYVIDTFSGWLRYRIIGKQDRVED